MFKIILYYINTFLYYIFKLQLFLLNKLTNILKNYTNIITFQTKHKINCGNTLNGILLCLLYIPTLFYTKSILLLLTIINSIVYHFFHKKRMDIRLIDIITNIINVFLAFIVSIYYKCYISTFIICIGSINFIYFNKSKLYTENKLIGVLAHSFLVQYLVVIGIILLKFNGITLI